MDAQSKKPPWISDKVWTSFQDAKKARKKPKWVPQNVWGDFQQFLAYFSELEARDAFEFSKDLDVPVLEDFDTFRQLVFNQPCAIIWPIVYSRASDPTLSEFEFLRRAPAFELVRTMRGPLHEPLPSYLTPTKDRKKHGKKIASYARKLSHELNQLLPLEQLPEDLLAPLAVHLKDVYEELSGQVVPRHEFETVTYGDLGPSFFRTAVEWLFFSEANTIFHTLATTADAWAQTVSAEPQTNESRVRRNNLVLELTRYFQSNFRDPHAGAVAEIMNAMSGSLSMSRQDVISIIDRPLPRPRH